MAIRRQTTDNKTRERALLLLERETDDLPALDRALLTSEWHFAVELSKTLGVVGVRRMLASMSSRDFTDYRAAALISIAQGEIQQAYAKEEERKRGRRRR